MRIGPHSAQADPGPVCFGLGGSEPTVTDAQLVLGYLDPEYYLGQRMQLDKAAAERVIEERIAQPLGLSLIEAANGIIHLTNMNMVLAMRQMTIKRGHDPRDFAFVCFGGGGGLFAGALLAELQMKQAIVPVNPAIFSAWGLLNADFREDVNQTLVFPMVGTSGKLLADKFAELAETLPPSPNDAPRTLMRFADCRYQGQEHTVTVPIEAGDFEQVDLATVKTRFDAYHEKAYAHNLPMHSAEIVNLRLRAVGITNKPQLAKMPTSDTTLSDALKGSRPVYFGNDRVDCPVYDRAKLMPGHQFVGPAIVEEWTSTVLIRPKQSTYVDAYGNLLITERNHA